MNARRIGGSVGVAVLAVALCGSMSFARELSFEDRVRAQKAIEEVYWSHRIWPEVNPTSKPPLSAVMTDEAIRANVEGYLRMSALLEFLGDQPIRADQLQGEIDRMVRESTAPGVLRELFAALGDDPFLVAECLARPVLAQRLAASVSATGQFAALGVDSIVPPAERYTLPQAPFLVCTDDTWTSTSAGANLPSGRTDHTAVWTGSEMIVWGGNSSGGPLITGGRYNPATNAWALSSLGSGSGTNVPSARTDHTAVWTGTEMIVWGGYDGSAYLNTGGRYNPTTDTWALSSLTIGSGANTPSVRAYHTAVWTGTEMIVWGGYNGSATLKTGGRYNPTTDAWATSSLTTGSGANVAPARGYHTAVWTGTEMIVWGGSPDWNTSMNTGGRYNPSADAWAASSLTTASGANIAAPSAGHTAVWTGTEMIVWGGQTVRDIAIVTGGRYNPATDTWASSSLLAGSGANTPEPRADHTAVWTGSEMIVWGGWGNTSDYLSTGGRFRPTTDAWVASSLTGGTGANVPPGRYSQTAIWTNASDHRMIVWGGSPSLQSGGLYCACGLWYQDLDADGRGNSTTTQFSCTQPAGYAAASGDCNDAVAGVWSTPSEARSLVFTTKSSLSWASPTDPGGTAPLYDTIRSTSASDFGAGGSCVESNGADTTTSDASSPSVGSAYFYLVRGETSCGLGSLGRRPSGAERTGRSCP